MDVVVVAAATILSHENIFSLFNSFLGNHLSGYGEMFCFRFFFPLLLEGNEMGRCVCVCGVVCCHGHHQRQQRQ